MDEVARSIKPIDVSFRVPALQWLRLQWLPEDSRSAVMEALAVRLRASLDVLGVPGTVEGLLDEGGHLKVAEGEAELAKRWEANYIYADGDPAGEEGKGDD